MQYKTEQEGFWAGSFGDQYTERNQGDQLLASNLSLFVQALHAIQPIEDMIEFGANVGMNLKALKLLLPRTTQYAIEINTSAVKKLEQHLPIDNIFCQSILNWQSEKIWDLVLIKGVLIHIDPNKLNEVYEKLVSSTKKYLLIVEYYNPSPIEVSYRGNTDKLFKRDFAGEIMEIHKNMQLKEYGFIYKGDANFPQDDITYFLLEKIS